MYSQSSMDHIVRDLIVRWQRTVLLVVLTAIGLMILVTGLIHSVLEVPSKNSAMFEAERSPSAASPATIRMFQEQRSLNKSSTAVSTGHGQFNKRQQPDPLARSIELSAVHSNDFRTRSRPLLISVSNSSEDNDALSTTRHLSPSFKSASELRLTETFADEMPRAVVIDGKHCVEGTWVQMGGKTFRVTNIRRYSVELLRNSELIEFRLPKMN